MRYAMLARAALATLHTITYQYIDIRRYFTMPRDAEMPAAAVYAPCARCRVPPCYAVDAYYVHYAML